MNGMYKVIETVITEYTEISTIAWSGGKQACINYVKANQEPNVKLKIIKA